jgi:hypothetical protein
MEETGKETHLMTAAEIRVRLNILKALQAEAARARASHTPAQPPQVTL